MVSKKKRLLAGMAISLGIGAAFCFAFRLDLLYTLQRQADDLIFRAAAFEETPPDGRIAIVTIDDRSLQRLGRFGQWPRSNYASLIDRLDSSGARVVVFDVLFSEPAPGDASLAAAMRNAGNVVLPITFRNSPNLSSPVPGTGFLKPLPVLEETAVATGHASVNPDADGVVRRLPAIIGNNGEYEPALSLAAVAVYLRRPDSAAYSGENVITLAGRPIPVGSNGAMLINYVGHAGAGKVSFPRKSFVDVLDGDFDPSFFQDRIVIVGVTAIGLGDTFWTPLGRVMNGVEIHASAISMILDGRFLRPAPASVTLALILLAGLLCGLAVMRSSILRASVVALVLCTIYFVAAFSFFDRGVMLNMLYPPMTIFVTYIGVNLYQVTSVQSEKREITRLFGRYVSIPVVTRTLEALGKGSLKLGGEEQEVTVAFFDVRGFSRLCENTSPEIVVSALNIYLSAIVDAVLRNGGMVNKFGGDSVMAVWNAPVPCAGHALLAIRAALDSQKAIGVIQNRSLLLPMEFGIGINTGKAIAGNIGSEDRLEYSVIGDAVNTASRLSSSTPGGKVWVGASTFSMAKDRVVARPVSQVVAKGKTEPVEAYQIEGLC